MAYNADIATATSMAPQLGTLTGSTTPTSTQANAIWGLAYNEVRMAFLRASLADTFTSSSVAKGIAEQAEMLLASGYILLAKGSVGQVVQQTAASLLERGHAILDGLWEQRDYLIANGASASLPNKSVFAKSNWTEDKNPDFNYTPGTADYEYDPPPVFQMGDEL